MVAVFSSLGPCSLDVIKHARVGEDNDEKCHQVQTCRETEGYVSGQFDNGSLI